MKFKKKEKILLVTFIAICVVFSIVFYIVINNLGTHASTDATLNIDDEYFLNRTSGHSVNLTDTEGFVIRNNVESFNYDREFIIARTSDDTKSSYYWIVNRTDNIRYKQLTEEEFKTKKNELSIELNLVEVSEFFK